MSLKSNKIEEVTDMIISINSSLLRHLKSMFMARRDLTLFNKSSLTLFAII